MLFTSKITHFLYRSFSYKNLLPGGDVLNLDFEDSISFMLGKLSSVMKGFKMLIYNGKTVNYSSKARLTENYATISSTIKQTWEKNLNVC